MDTHGYWGSWLDYKVWRAAYREEDWCRRELRKYGIDLLAPKVVKARRVVLRERRRELTTAKYWPSMSEGKYICVTIGTGADPAPETPNLFPV